MNIGVFSGTFDPVHNGHIGFAETAREQLGLDSVVFMPERSPRRKQNASPLKFRAEMLELALKDKEWAAVHQVKLDNHTAVETMGALRQKYGSDNDFFLLMGVDVYEHINEWQGYEDLLRTTKTVLGLRTEDDGEVAIELAAELGDKPLMIVSSDPGLSSSDIRSGASKNVSRGVASYIKEHGLYV